MAITRKINAMINSDPQIIDLRMQAEDLINAIDHLPDDAYKKEAQKIKTAIDLRIAQIIAQNT